VPVIAEISDGINTDSVVQRVVSLDEQNRDSIEGRRALQALQVTVANIKSELSSNSQLTLSNRLKEELDISNVRIALNKVR
jgi:hypothetical protein